MSKSSLGLLGSFLSCALFVASANAHVRGTVYCDTNGNGVFDAGDHGISGVTVTLCNGDTRVTDANGNYSFDYAPPTLPCNVTVDVTTVVGDCNVPECATTVTLTEVGYPFYDNINFCFIPPPPACPPTTDGLPSNFNSQMPASAWVWFNANISANSTQPATVFFKNSSITIIGKSGTTYTYPVPDGEIIFSASASCASSTFSGTQWITTVPLNGSDEIFLAGLGVPALNDFKGSSFVKWQGDFTSDVPGFQLNWKWSAAVYLTDMTQYSSLGVKASHNGACSTGAGFNNSDHAGTPENEKNFLAPGARGGGGSNFTGSWSGTHKVTLCPGTTD